MDGRKAGITAARLGRAEGGVPPDREPPRFTAERPGLHSTGRTIIIPIGGEAL
ncbi:hypothetical protein [Paenibacillus sp. cl141a]|uniref:hypothetical protein n=1 Tax=Paenibacillus sp. cl141a TaxID=1761877 RepID=UPI0015877195|nr:hypothetical protein [Paenibacillus sp. cl141a]